jgi:hypothetical protein
VTHLAVYHFWNQCEHTLGINENFQPFLDPEIKGSTVNMVIIDLSKFDSGSCGQKCKNKNDFADMTAHLTSMMIAQETHSKALEKLMTYALGTRNSYRPVPVTVTDLYP